MTDYIATQKITGGPYDGQALSAVHPTITGFGDYNFTWTLPEDFGTFADLGIIGFKIVGEFTGTGDMAWSWEIDNPGSWTSGDGTFIAWDNAYPGGIVNVSGSTSYEHVFALTDTAADPTYEGFSYSDPLGDLDYSLRATVATAGFDHTIGTIAGDSDSTAVVVLRWDLVLFTADTAFVFVGNLDDATPVTRLFPRDDTLGVGGPNRIIPAPRSNRIIGNQP